MARKLHEDAFGVAGAATTIGAGVTVTGALRAESDVTIDGTMHGDISAGGTVTVGVNANLRSNIEASSVIIGGSLTGNIQTEGEVSILATGSVKGNVMSGGLAIEHGGVFVGQSRLHSVGSSQSDVADTTHSSSSPSAKSNTVKS